jgi:hypothetical protein
MPRASPAAEEAAPAAKRDITPARIGRAGRAIFNRAAALNFDISDADISDMARRHVLDGTPVDELLAGYKPVEKFSVEDPSDRGPARGVGAQTETVETVDGPREQGVIPGAETESGRAVAERKMSGRKRADKEQKGVDDLPLFGDHGQGELFKVSDELTARFPFVLSALRAEMNRLGLKGVDISERRPTGVPESIGERDVLGAFGFFLDPQRGLIPRIYVSPQNAAPLRTTRHEILHALRALGLITDGEWRALVARSRAVWREKYNIDRRYAHEADEAVRDEEGVAEAFSDYKAGNYKPGGRIERVLAKIKKFLESLGNALRGNGFIVAETVFDRIESGEVGARARQSRHPRDVAFSAGTGASRPSLSGKGPVAVVDAGTGLSGGTFAAARRRVQRWAFDNIRGTYRNTDTGWDIDVTRGGINKATSDIRFREELATLRSVPKLLETAVLVETLQPRAGRPDVRAAHVFYGATRVGGKTYRMRIVVLEDTSGRRFYDQHATELESPPGAAGDPTDQSRAGRQSPEGLTISIGDLLAGVKYEDGTPVPAASGARLSIAPDTQRPAVQHLARIAGTSRDSQPRRPQGCRSPWKRRHRRTATSRPRGFGAGQAKIVSRKLTEICIIKNSRNRKIGFVVIYEIIEISTDVAPNRNTGAVSSETYVKVAFWPAPRKPSRRSQSTISS